MEERGNVEVGAVVVAVAAEEEVEVASVVPKVAENL